MNAPTHIRAVIFQDGDAWVAQCLEHDIGVQAPDLDTLHFRLAVALEVEAQEGLERHGQPFGGIAPAPKSYHQMWEAGSGKFTPSHATPIRSDGTEIDLDMKLAA